MTLASVPAQLIRRLHTVRSGDIVVLHDGFHGVLGADRHHTVCALEYWLPRWKEQGLACVALGADAEPRDGIRSAAR